MSKPTKNGTRNAYILITSQPKICHGCGARVCIVGAIDGPMKTDSITSAYREVRLCQDCIVALNKAGEREALVEP